MDKVTIRPVELESAKEILEALLEWKNWYGQTLCEFLAEEIGGVIASAITCYHGIGYRIEITLCEDRDHPQLCEKIKEHITDNWNLGGLQLKLIVDDDQTTEELFELGDNGDGDYDGC